MPRPPRLPRRRPGPLGRGLPPGPGTGAGPQRACRRAPLAAAPPGPDRAGALCDVFEPFAHGVELRIWALRGRPMPPPPAFKQRTVAAYARRFSLTTLIETGTFLGDMTRAASRVFERVISIEFDPGLHARARQRLGRFSNVALVAGDSGDVLHDLVPSLSQPCLFWLDAHYSGRLSGRSSLDTPIVRELEAVLSPSGLEHVVLIDDARCFTGAGDYPALEDLRPFVLGLRPAWAFEVADDIIRCHARPPGPRKSD